jgi:hypothetical protein
VDEIELVGLVDRHLDFVSGHASPQINQGADRAGDGNPMMVIPIGVLELATAMDVDPARPSYRARGDGHMDLRVTRWANRPQRGRRVVAQDCLGTARENGGEPSPESREVRSSDRIHASMDGMQPAPGDPVRDRLRAVAKLEELDAGDDPVLGCGERPERSRSLRVKA